MIKVREEKQEGNKLHESRIRNKMRIILCWLLMSLSVIHYATVFGNSIIHNSKYNYLLKADNQLQVKQVVVEETTSAADISKESLRRSRFAFLASETIRSTTRRRKREVVPAVSVPSDSRTDILDQERSTVRDKIDGSSFTSRGNFTTRHAKHRRRRRCKNRLGCIHFGYQNNSNSSNSSNEMRNPSAGHQRHFQEEDSYNRNLEQHLLVGNRSLALFRQELAAAAAAAAATITKSDIPNEEALRKVKEDILVDANAKEIDNYSSDPKPRNSQRITRLLMPKILLKDEEIRTNVTEEINDSAENDTEETAMINDGQRETTEMEQNSNDRLNNEEKISDGPFDELEDDFEWSIDDQKIVINETKRKIDTAESTEKNVLDGTLMASIYLPVDDRVTIHESLGALLSRLFNTLKNSTTIAESRQLLRDLDSRKNSLDNNEVDMCQKWLDSKDKLEEAFLGPLVYLPACPCQYPSSIFYDDKIWDEKQKKYFRWRDVSGDSERLDVYKPGASYCVRSLLAQGTGHAAAQHCCYDRRRRLLTRGSGAGTPNFVSPEISLELHERIDILPWRLCKGDFSRFNKVRPPNNDNHCKSNPDDVEYQRQIESTKYY